MTAVTWILLGIIPGLIVFPMFKGPADIDSTFPERKWFRDALVYAGRALLFSVIWPLILLLKGLDETDKFIRKLRKRQKTRKGVDAVEDMRSMIQGNYYDDGKLRFSHMGGKGNFYCTECGYSQELVSFLHGISDWSKTGYQCQKCGKFHEIVRDHELTEEPECDCGGSLSREKPLFCPVCKTFKVGYHMTLIT
jgi:predicted nucleic acid-binding Zn ribbon protein